MNIRDNIRKWLGFSSVEIQHRKSQSDTAHRLQIIGLIEKIEDKLTDFPSKSNLAGHEAADRRRHDELIRRLDELQIHVQGRADGLLTKLNEINSRLTATVQKANHPANFQAPELSWETVQQIALLDLEKEQEQA